MREHFTEALVLDREDMGESDLRIHLFTEQLGRITARATSARKITSKLSAHLEPANLIQVRLVETGGFQIADAIAVRRPDFASIRTELEILRLIHETTALEHPDASLWVLIKKGKMLGKEILVALGFDPAFARCFSCSKPEPKHFILKEAHYLCAECFKKQYSQSRSGLSTSVVNS